MTFRELARLVEIGNVDAIRRRAEQELPLSAGDMSGQTALMIAAQLGRAEIVEVLLAKGALVSIQDNSGMTALHWAAMRSANAAIITFLIRAGADVNARDGLGRTPLFEAAIKGHTENVRALIAGGADVNALTSETESPLSAATAWGHVHCVRALLEAGANPDHSLDIGVKAIDIARHDGRWAIVRLLSKWHDKRGPPPSADD